MKNINFTREFTENKKTNVLENKIRDISFEYEDENPLDEIVHYLICADLKNKTEQELNFNNSATLNRLESAQIKLNKYIKELRNGNSE